MVEQTLIEENFYFYSPTRCSSHREEYSHYECSVIFSLNIKGIFTVVGLTIMHYCSKVIKYRTTYVV